MSAQCVQNRIRNGLIKLRPAELILFYSYVLVVRCFMWYECTFYCVTYSLLWLWYYCLFYYLCLQALWYYTQILNMHDITPTRVTVGSPTHTPMWFCIHAHEVTLRWSCNQKYMKLPVLILNGIRSQYRVDGSVTWCISVAWGNHCHAMGPVAPVCLSTLMALRALYTSGL